jgi:hypothetical protein
MSAGDGYCESGLPAGGGEFGRVPVLLDRVVPSRVSHDNAAVHEAERNVRGRSGLLARGAGQAGRGCGHRERGGGKEGGGQARGAEKS